MDMAGGNLTSKAKTITVKHLSDKIHLKLIESMSIVSGKYLLTSVLFVWILLIGFGCGRTNTINNNLVLKRQIHNLVLEVISCIESDNVNKEISLFDPIMLSSLSKDDIDKIKKRMRECNQYSINTKMEMPISLMWRREHYCSKRSMEIRNLYNYHGFIYNVKFYQTNQTDTMTSYLNVIQRDGTLFLIISPSFPTIDDKGPKDEIENPEWQPLD